MKTAGWIALTALAVAMTGCSGAKAPYTSKAGNFRIDMPGTPKETDQEAPSPLGGTLKMHSLTASDSKNVAYMVVYGDYPDGLAQPQTLDRVLAAVAAGFIRGSGFTELETKQATLYGHQGREVSFEAKSATGAKGLGRSRIFLAGNRLFQVMIVGPEANATPEVAKAYFDSFSLLEKVTPVMVGGAPTPPATNAPPVARQSAGSSLAVGVAAKAEHPGWGTLYDPLDDCKVVAKDDTLTITVPGTLHDFNPPPGRFDAPRILQDVNGDFTADVQIPEEPRPAGKSLGAGLPFHGAGLLAVADEKNYVRLERAGILRGGSITLYALFEGREKGQRIGQDGNMPPGATFLRLQRKGEWIYAFASRDGRDWTRLGSAKITWPDAAKVGVMAVNSADRVYSARFWNLKITQP